MAWTLLPATNGADIQDWRLWKELRDAAVERGQALFCIWPRPNRPYSLTGIVGSITETSMTDTGASWCGGLDDVSGLGYAAPFLCIVSTPDNGYIPTTWQLVIDDPDVDKIVRSSIASHCNTGTVTFANIRDYATSKQIPSIASLVGKQYWINGGGGLTPEQRLKTWPNDYEWANGSVVSLPTNLAGGVVIPASPAAGLIRIDNPLWSGGTNLVGKDLLFYGGDGFLKRHAITSASNIATSILLRYAGTDVASVGPAFCAVSAGARAYPGRGPTFPLEFYRGAREGYKSLDANNSVGDANLSAKFVSVPGSLLGGGCGDINFPAWDALDIFTDTTPTDDNYLVCSRPVDFCYTVDVYKTQHGLDAAVNLFSLGGYIEATDHTGADAVPLLNPAEMHRIAGVNSYSGTTGDVVGASSDDGSSNNQIAVSGFSFPPDWWFPINVWYSIREADGTYFAGRGTLLSANLLSADTSGSTVFQQAFFDSGTSLTTPHESGRAIYITPGLTRYPGLGVKRLDDDCVFIPDLVDDGSGGFTIQDPPSVAAITNGSCLGMGRWSFRGKSETYIEFVQDNADSTVPQGFAFEGSNTNQSHFKAGDVACFAGDEFYGPSINQGGNSFIKTTDADGTELYWSRFYVGGHPTATRNFIAGQFSGTATLGGSLGGSNFFLYDPSKNWFDHHWFGSGSNGMRLETGTATGGSTTLLIDASKIEANPSSPTNAVACAWRGARFGTSGASYITPHGGFTVAVDFGTGTNAGLFIAPNVDWRLIAGGTPSTATLSWAEPMRASANGKPYEIAESYKLNRYRGRPVLITPSNGASFTGTVTGNSASVLFLTAPASNSLGTGSGYKITEYETSNVFRRDSNNASWQIVTGGTDTARIGVVAGDRSATNFVSYSPGNLTHRARRYGNMQPGDSIYKENLNERQKLLDTLVWVKQPMTWDDKPSPTAPDEANGKGAGTGPMIGPWSSVNSSFSGVWASTTPAAGAPLPVATRLELQEASTSCYSVSAARAYAYPVTTRSCIRFANAYEFWVKATGPAGTAPGTTTVAGVSTHVIFDNYGDGVQLGWSSVGGSNFSGTNTTVYGSAVGDTGLSEPGNDGDPAGFPAKIVSGYTIIDQCRIDKFNAAGGFKYYTP
jgi:hypothetical protein